MANHYRLALYRRDADDAPKQEPNLISDLGFEMAEHLTQEQADSAAAAVTMGILTEVFAGAGFAPEKIIELEETDHATVV